MGGRAGGAVKARRCSIGLQTPVSVAHPFCSGLAVPHRNWSTTVTTTDLVPVFAGTLAGQPAQLCNARDLHAALEVGRDFSTWIKDRLAEYAFAEGEDFSVVTAPPIRGAGNRGKRTDYHLTLDTAKELAIVENNDIGRRIRRYLIALERQQKQAAPALPPPVSALDRQTRSRINRRALELSHRAYETYRDQMLTCHLIKSNRVEIEEWLPPQLTEDVIRRARLAANFLGIYSKSIHDTASAIARLAGLETPTEG